MCIVRLKIYSSAGGPAAHKSKQPLQDIAVDCTSREPIKEGVAGGVELFQARHRDAHVHAGAATRRLVSSSNRKWWPAHPTAHATKKQRFPANAGRADD